MAPTCTRRNGAVRTTILFIFLGIYQFTWKEIDDSPPFDTRVSPVSRRNSTYKDPEPVCDQCCPPQSHQRALVEPGNALPTSLFVKTFAFMADERFPKYLDARTQTILQHAMSATGTTLNGTALAPCRISHRKPELLQHFPHAMEVLYLCFDYWVHHRHDAKAVLVYAEQDEPFWKAALASAPFLSGVVEALEQKLGVRQMSMYEYQQHMGTESEQDIGLPVQLKLPYQGFYLNSTLEWNEMIYSHLFNITLSKECGAFPRIRILNRANTRKIVNADRLAEQLSTNTSRVQVSYLEGSNFSKQVGVFKDTDILISSHGAQLTGLSMLSNKPCSHLLELFPQDYALPAYFGSLAVFSGVRHSYMYLGNGTDTEVVLPWETRVGATQHERKKARIGQLCPRIRIVQAAVDELVGDWNKCCENILTSVLDVRK